MKKKLVTLLAFITTALVLVACGGGVEVPSIPTVEVTANPVSADPVATFTGTHYVDVEVPADFGDAPDTDLVVLEADGDNVQYIIVYHPDGSIYGASESPHLFVPPAYLQSLGTGTLSGFETMAMQPDCKGPCVMIELTGGTMNYIVEVKSTGKTDFYAYGGGFGDAGEPTNDNKNTARQVNLGDSFKDAAFELLWDTDYYQVTDSGELSIYFEGPWASHTDINIVLEFVDSPTTPPMKGHELIDVLLFKDETIKIYIEDGRAGDYLSSQYRVKFNN